MDVEENVAISCNNVSKSYLTVKALGGISMVIKKGESVALVGANGAGKSTLFNILLGLSNPDEGASSVLGVTSDKITPAIRSRIGFIADHAGPIPWASSNDIAGLYSSIYPKWNKHLYLELMDSWMLDPARRLNQLSKGQKRLAEIAITTATEPDIIILDEPFNGLDAVMRIQIQRLLRKLQKDTNVTVLYASHILTELSSVADRMVVLRHGRIVYDNIITGDDQSPQNIFINLYNEEICGKQR
jgi:ABC-2 type transport system ATP-binding protein